MTMLRASNEQLLETFLDDVFFGGQDYENNERLINTLFKVRDINKKYTRGLVVKGMPLLSLKNEGEAYSAADIEEAWYTDITPRGYGIKTTISHQMQKQEQYGIIREFPEAMRPAAEATVQYYASRVFSEGFSSLPATMSGERSSTEYLFSTSHTLKNGATASNRPSTDADLSMTSLWAAVNAFYEFVNEAGIPIAESPKILLVPHQEQQTMIELLQSELHPETEQNAINALRRAYNIQGVVWPYWLGSVDSDCWFLLNPTSRHYKIYFVWQERLWTKMWIDEETDNINYSCYEAFGEGWFDWRAAYGSSGAA